MWRTYGAPEPPRAHWAVVLPGFFLHYQTSIRPSRLELAGWLAGASEEKKAIWGCVCESMCDQTRSGMCRYIWSPIALWLCSRALSTGVSVTAVQFPWQLIRRGGGLGTGSDAMLSLHFCCKPGTSRERGTCVVWKGTAVISVTIVIGILCTCVCVFWSSCGIFF